MIFNPLNNPENQTLSDLTRRELVVMLPLIFGIVWLGLFPGPVLRRTESATRVFVEAARPTSTPATAHLGSSVPLGRKQQ
jgi:NADH-quinone oxidoreductase subunit M